MGREESITGSWWINFNAIMWKKDDDNLKRDLA